MLYPAFDVNLLQNRIYIGLSAARVKHYLVKLRNLE